MNEQEFEAAWIEVCSELRMSMDGVYFEAAVLLAKKAEAKEREACAKTCEGLFSGNPVPSIGNGYAANCAAAIRMRSNVELTGD